MSGMMQLLVILTVIIGPHACKYTNKILITVTGDFNSERFNSVLERYGLRYSRQILRSVYEYELTVNRLSTSTRTAIKQATENTIIDIYREEEIKIQADVPRKQLSQLFVKLLQKRSLKNLLLVCSPYYGMEIMDAWRLGYKGQGVVVGVVDTGVEITHIDIKHNIEQTLCYNFVSGQKSSNVNPDILPSYMEYDTFSDHGNNCAGLISAEQGNMFCSSGVAPEAKTAVLKVFGLNDPTQSSSMYKFTPASLIQALTYRSDRIHIYSNSYGPEEVFAKSTTVVNTAFKNGVEKGRDGKGSIYVIAVGNKGKYQDANLDGYVNSIYTIAISSVGVNGTIPGFVQPGACILASTYGEGQNKFDRRMITISHENTCTDEFKGTSASAAIASGIIALTLQANQDLTWRDVQHLIINTSCVIGLEEQNSVTVNSAGFKYHKYFGFGLMNASALVAAARGWKRVPEAKILQASCVNRNDDKNETVQTLTLKICGEIDGCLSFTEHVIAYVDFIFYRSFSMELELCSPMKTCSLLLNKHGINKSLQTKKIRRKWNFMSLQFWGENPSGKWILRMYQTSTETSRKGRPFSILLFNLTVYGYTEELSDVYKEIEHYAFKKVDKLAEVLDIEIPKEEKGTNKNIFILICLLLVGLFVLVLV